VAKHAPDRIVTDTKQAGDGVHRHRRTQRHQQRLEQLPRETMIYLPNQRQAG
jgi:hypothetical protein